MTFADLTPAIALASSVIALLALVFLFVLNRRLTAALRAQKVVLGSKGEVDMVKYVGSLEEKVINLRTMVEDLAVAGKDHEVRIDNCLSHMGAVRFDAFHDLGGRQSTSVAFLNATEDGVVITSAVSREFARVYVKLLRDGQPDIPLGPEEMEAVDLARARGNAPFTVRPRQERERLEAERADDDIETPLSESAAAARALERENRRRKRLGLAPVDELPPLPSSLGWPKVEPADDERPEPEVAATGTSEETPATAGRDRM
ncbi:MAG: DUF4446 family protein [Thermoleophilia bacterium]